MSALHKARAVMERGKYEEQKCMNSGEETIVQEAEAVRERGDEEQKCMSRRGG